jgi:hypothetical protein
VQCLPVHFSTKVPSDTLLRNIELPVTGDANIAFTTTLC